MTDINFNLLSCPVCKKPLSKTEANSLVCEGVFDAEKKGLKKHCFDIAKSGYVNLICGKSSGGDSKECVKCRTDFLELGYYKKISNTINLLAQKYAKEGVTLDAGCGEGYYSNAYAKETGNHLFGIDISKPAVEHSAKNAKAKGLRNAFFAVAGIFALPFLDNSFDLIINIFAPCAELEFKRVLKDNGILIIASAGVNHLFELKEAIYDIPNKNEARADFPSDMELVEKTTVSYSIDLKSQEEIQNLFAMTPYYYRTSLEDKDKLSRLTSLTTTVEVDFSVYRKNG